MANGQAEKLTLVPVTAAALIDGASTADRPQAPESQTRLSPRAAASQVAHHPVGNASRLSRDSFLQGDWAVIDVDRQESEIRILLRAAAVVLSGREREVLRAVLHGVSDRAVSQQLGITRQCVCGHLANGLSKMGTESRFAALQVWRLLAEVERGRSGRAQIAEVQFGDEKLLSIRCVIPPRPEIEVRLSAAENRVAWLVCDGLSNRDIALTRGSAERTVANQVAAIFSKLDCSRRFDVAQFLLGLR